MATSLSNLADNPSERIQKIKCNTVIAFLNMNVSKKTQ